MKLVDAFKIIQSEFPEASIRAIRRDARLGKLPHVRSSSGKWARINVNVEELRAYLKALVKA